MRIHRGAKIRIIDANQVTIDWLNQERVLPNPDYAKKARMGLSTYRVPRTLCLFEKDGDDYLVPAGDFRRLLELAGSDLEVITDEFKAPLFTINYEAPALHLYNYQQEAVNELIRAGGGILQAPAGSGKTQMAIGLIQMLRCKALWLTHTADLLQQSKKRAECYMDPALMGTITAGQVEIGEGITFATVQTMEKLDLNQYRDTWPLVIVDECHRCSGTPTQVTRFSKILNSLAAVFKYGLSATIHRSDGLIACTHSLLGPIAYSVPEKAVADKIMTVDIFPVLTGIPMPGGKAINPDMTINFTGLITELTIDIGRNAMITRMIAGCENQSCLILSDRVNHLEHMAASLPAHLIPFARIVSGKMSSKKGREEREQIMEDMRSGKASYLFATYALAKEGLDIPCLENLFLTTPQKDYAIVTQSIGRIARTAEGKTKARCFDFVDNFPYAINAWKKRCTTYRKIRTTIHEGVKP